MIRINKILSNKLFCKNIKELEQAEKDRPFCRHGIEHLLSVARIMMIKSFEDNINISKELIYAAALLHDIGRTKSYQTGIAHSKESSQVANKILKECDFSDYEIDQITDAILHHNDCEKVGRLCSLLRASDRISRNCFMCNAYHECYWSEHQKNKEVII